MLESFHLQLPKKSIFSIYSGVKGETVKHFFLLTKLIAAQVSIIVLKQLVFIFKIQEIGLFVRFIP
jgi:hypothetical protein